MTGEDTRAHRALRRLAPVLALGGCIPMVAMLPAAAAATLGAIGVRASSGPFAPVARVLAPVGGPLIIAATAALVAGLLRCGRLPTLVGGAGGTLLYVSMYVASRVRDGAGGAGMRAMAGMGGAAVAGGAGTTNGRLFYLGLTLFVGAYVLPFVRRRRGSCQPVRWPRRVGTGV